MPVVPGTFVNTREPAVVGSAQVGVPLTAGKGAWSPKASIAFQWMVGNVEVPGATSKSFTPRPQDVGLPVRVEILASRDGYLTGLAVSPATADVLPGLITAKQAPAVTGRAMVGHTLHASSGSWSLDPVTLSYQWYRGSHRIAGATEAAYRPTAADAGRRLHVVVTASSAGYTPASAESTTTHRVLLGVAELAKPTVSGRAVLGATLHAHVASFAPAGGTPTYRWLRGHEPIRGAHDATYVLQPDDVGHRVHVQVTLQADHWVPATGRSVSTVQVRTVPVLHARTSIRHGRIHLRLRVVSPGLEQAPTGTARAWRSGRNLGGFTVVDGRGARLLAPMRAGTNVITVVYRGDALETAGRISVTVTVP